MALRGRRVFADYRVVRALSAYKDLMVLRGLMEHKGFKV